MCDGIGIDRGAAIAIEKFLLRLHEYGDDPSDGLRKEYEKTSNPLALFLAMSNALALDIEIPQWIVTALVNAASSVAGAIMFESQGVKSPIPPSMDVALGIKSTRGKSSYITADGRAWISDKAFVMIEALRACYEINIERACEAAYYFRDDGMAAHVRKVHDGNRQLYKTDKDYNEALSELLKDARMAYGEMLGVSVDSLISRYYREGQAFRDRHPENTQDALVIFWSSILLGKFGVRCAWDNADADPRNFPRRHEFRKLAEDLGL